MVVVNFFGNQVFLDGVGMDVVVNLRKFTFGRPAERFLLLFLKALELFDKIEFEGNTNS